MGYTEKKTHSKSEKQVGKEAIVIGILIVAGIVIAELLGVADFGLAEYGIAGVILLVFLMICCAWWDGGWEGF